MTEGVSGQQFMRHVESSWTRLDDAATRAIVNNDGEFLGYLTEQHVGCEASYKFGFSDWMRGGLQPQLEGGLEVCWAHMNCGGERLQGPPEPWEGDRLYVDVTVQLCEDLDSLRLHEALAECCKHSTMLRYRWRYNWSPFGPVKQEFAAHERTTNRCTFEEWHDQKRAKEKGTPSRRWQQRLDNYRRVLLRPPPPV